MPLLQAYDLCRDSIVIRRNYFPAANSLEQTILVGRTSQRSDKFNVRLFLAMVKFKTIFFGGRKQNWFGGTPPATVADAPTPAMQPLNSWRMEEKMGLCQSEQRCECQSLLEQLREIRELRERVQELEAKAASQTGKSSWRRTDS